MERIAVFFRNLWKDERGEVAIEYGLLVALVALALIVVFNLFGTEIGNFFNRITNRVADCPNVGGCS